MQTQTVKKLNSITDHFYRQENNQKYLNLLEEKLSKNKWQASLFSTISAVIFSLIKTNKLLSNNHKICYSNISKETRQMFRCVLDEDYSFFKINRHADLNKINIRGKKGLGVVYLRPTSNDLSNVFWLSQAVKTFDEHCLVVLDISQTALCLNSLHIDECVDAIICQPKNVSSKYQQISAGVLLSKNQEFVRFNRNIRKCLGNALAESICEQFI